MQTHILLQILITVNFVVISFPRHVVFKPKVLLLDLDALWRYYTKGDTALIAYIHWPESITFRVQWIEEESLGKENLIKIDGEFQYRKLVKMSNSYDGLYYRSGQFFIKDSNAEKMEKIEFNTKIYYVQPPMTETKPYLSIRYFSLKDLNREVNSFFSSYEICFHRDHGSTFLANVPNPDGHFLIYTISSEFQQKFEGSVRILRGKKTMDKVKVSDMVQRSELRFYPEEHSLGIYDNSGIKSFQKYAFGISDVDNAYVAEVLESGVTMFTKSDFLLNGPLPARSRQLTPDDKLLEKVKNAALKYPHSTSPWCLKRVKFQIYGIILVKSVNYVTYDVINKDCPFVVEFEDQQGFFVIEDQRVQKLCTNDTKLWMEEDQHKQFIGQ